MDDITEGAEGHVLKSSDQKTVVLQRCSLFQLYVYVYTPYVITSKLKPCSQQPLISSLNRRPVMGHIPFLSLSAVHNVAPQCVTRRGLNQEKISAEGVA